MFSILGSIFGITQAYLTGKIQNSTETINPFVDAGLYYNNSLLQENAITGSIDASGNLSLNVGGNALTPTNNVINLPLTIKNTGNINAELFSIFVQIDFYDGENLSPVSNNNGEDSYYITLVAPNTYTIEDNMFYTFNTVTLNKNGGNSSQILNSLLISNIIGEDDGEDADAVCGKTFKIHFYIEVLQEGADEL